VDPGRVGAVVLAAGQSSRFGSPKHLAPLGGRPLLAHVLDALASAGLGEIVVVLGHAADDVEPIVTVPSARIVRNPDPDAGLSSSLAVGIAALAPWVEAALVALGDQPLLRPGTIRALVAAPEPVGTRSRSHPARATLPGRATRPTRTTPPRPATLPAGPTLPGRATRPTRATPPAAAAIAFVPAYAGGGSPNPVLLLRAGWGLVGEASGDQGLGPLLRARPELTREVPVEGSNPDVDTPGDLLALAWAERVRADREQVDRVREVPDDADFYGPIVGRFVEDPRRTGDAALDALLSLVEPGETGSTSERARAGTPCPSRFARAR